MQNVWFLIHILRYSAASYTRYSMLINITIFLIVAKKKTKNKAITLTKRTMIMHCIHITFLLYKYSLCISFYSMLDNLHYLWHTISNISLGFINVSRHICSISCLILICCNAVSFGGWLCGDFKMYVSSGLRINTA